jgi:hypothetical protein
LWIDKDSGAGPLFRFSALRKLNRKSTLGCVEWICQVDGVGLLPYADNHRFVFTAQATDKTYGRVVFEGMEVRATASMFTSI